MAERWKSIPTNISVGTNVQLSSLFHLLLLLLMLLFISAVLLIAIHKFMAHFCSELILVVSLNLHIISSRSRALVVSKYTD